MKKSSVLFKVIAIVLLALGVSSCFKKDDPYEGYTAEREANLTKEWITEMTKKGKNVDTIDTNIYYIIDKEGTGENVKSGDDVTVKYTGMFIDGTVFDASAYYNEAGTMTYQHKGTESRMIPGWETGIELLNKGAKAVFLFPSAKAYGTGGYSSIPPYSPLIFVIEVVDIK